MPARGDQDAGSRKSSFCGGEFKAVVFRFQSSDTFRQADFHPGFPGFPLQAVDNGPGRVRDRKQAAIRLGFQLHAPFGKPADGILIGKTGKQLFQKAGAPRLSLQQLREGGRSVGDVAAASAGHLDFPQYMLSFFKEDDAGVRKSRGCRDRSEEPRSPASDNGNGVFHDSKRKGRKRDASLP